MWWNVRYSLLYFVVIVVLGIGSFLLANGFNHLARRLFSYKKAVVDSVTVGIFILLVCASLVLPYFILQSWFVSPPSSGARSSDEEFGKVKATVEELRQVEGESGGSKEDYFRKLINDALESLDALQKKVDKQNRIVLMVSENQLEKVFQLEEDAKTAANESFLYGVIVSFPIGILSSLVASILHRKLQDR